MAVYKARELPRWVDKIKGLQNAVIQTSAQRLAEKAQLQGPSVARGGGKGGRLPIDEGFLRATFSAQIGAMPAGPSEAPAGGFTGGEDEWAAPVTLVIAGMRPGDVLFMGWSAKYARAMEARYGFMKGAAEEWQSIVDGAVREAKARFG